MRGLPDHEPFRLPNSLSDVALFGMSMTDNQTVKPRSKGSSRKIALLGAGATALAVINMSTGSEAQALPVLILEFVALAGGQLALVGGLIMMMTSKR